jgi:hypothetical protein
MLLNQKNKLIDVFISNLRPLDNRPLWEWLEQNISLPNVYHPQGAFHIDFYPYLKFPMLSLLDDNIKQINAASCVQAGKSMLQQLYIPYIIIENPGPVLMVHDTGDNAKKCAEERIIPLLRNNKDTKRLLDSQRFSARKSGVQLPHMTFRIGGPTESNLIGYSARVVLGDECWRWQADFHKDVFSKLKGRQLAYNATKKSIFSSQPDYEGSDWHKECMKGLWYEWGYTCPHCKKLQLYEWNGITKDEKEYGMIFDKTKNNDYNKKAASARLVCQYCFHEIHDTPLNRKALVSNGDYLLVHSGPDPSIHTYSWNQFVNISIPFRQIGMEYFEAVLQKRNEGLMTKHELFRQQIMGRFWKIGQQIETPKLFSSAYKSTEEWADETIRFLTIDVQQDFLYWLVRSWSNKVAESRLIDWGAVATFNEIEDIITKYKIDPLCIGIDSGANTREVYKESCQRAKVKVLPNGKRILCQWTCLRGDGGLSPLSPRKFYKHKIEENGRVIEIDRLYSTLQYVDPQWSADSKFKILKAQLYNWSNLSIKLILQKLRDNKLPFAWKTNERADNTYISQMFSEELSKKTGRFEKISDKNHIWDLECEQLVMSLLAGAYVPAAESMDEIHKTDVIGNTKIEINANKADNMLVAA